MRILVDRDDDERRILVLEQRRDGSRLYFDSGALYTHVDAEGRNLLNYIAAMERTLKGADSVLLLGTAGGALATQLSRRGAAVTAVDNWPMAFEIARRWFHLPEEVKCVHADAMTFLRSTSEQWSAVAVDVFDGLEIPESMLTTDMAGLLSRAVRPDGLIVWNVADSPTSWTSRWIAKALRLEGLAPTLLSVMEGGVGNTLVVCRNRPRPEVRRGEAQIVPARPPRGR
jgi:predicted membrane-bound spermidine synthase